MRQAPDKPEELRIEFAKGVPVKVCLYLLYAADTIRCVYIWSRRAVWNFCLGAYKA